MRKTRTIVRKLQDQLAAEVTAADLRVVGGGRLTITQGSDGHCIVVGDQAY
jgi:hypothetical protein